MSNIIIYPFSLILRLFYDVLGSYGGALILFALLLAVIRLPFDVKSKRSMMRTTLVTPRINALREKYSTNQQKLNEEMSKLYREENIKPMGGCVWSLIPLVIVIILYQLVRQPLTHLMGLGEDQIATLVTTLEAMGHSFEGANAATSQLAIAGYIHDNYEVLKAAVPEIFDLRMTFLTLDLGSVPRWNFFLQDGWTVQDFGLFMLPVISTILSFISSKVSTATSYQETPAEQAQTMKTMMLMMPLMSLWIGFSWPAALSIYWTSNSAFMMISNVIMNRHFKGIYAGMKAEQEEKDRIKEAELEAKRKETERLRALNATRENKSTSKKKKQLAERERERQRLAAERGKSGEREEDDNPSRVGHRKYARGRAYDPDRFGGVESGADSAASAIDDELGRDQLDALEAAALAKHGDEEPVPAAQLDTHEPDNDEEDAWELEPDADEDEYEDDDEA